MLKLMYITNKPWIAKIAEDAGVDIIFVDFEWIGKDRRQRGLNTVQNRHTFDDVKAVKQFVKKAKVLVRVNPIHSGIDNYPDSDEEILQSVEVGADILMLPYFKTMDEVLSFIRLKKHAEEVTKRRVETCLLVETPQAADFLEQLVKLEDVNMIYFGLNDMHLEMEKKFMFQILSEGYLDKWCEIVKTAGIPYGFGGLAGLNGGAVPGNMILKEIYRLESSMVILSRSFCNANDIKSADELRHIFISGVAEIRELEDRLSKMDSNYFISNKEAVKLAVKQIVNG